MDQFKGYKNVDNDSRKMIVFVGYFEMGQISMKHLNAPTKKQNKNHLKANGALISSIIFKWRQAYGNDSVEGHSGKTLWAVPIALAADDVDCTVLSKGER